MDRELKRRRWIIHKKLQNWPEARIASALKINVRTVRRWWSAYQEGGWDALSIKPKKPRTIHRTSQKIVDRVLEIRKEFGQNEKAIVANLSKEGIHISHSTVYRILNSNGLVNNLEKPRRKKTYKSWSRKHPNSLWQTDLCIYKNKWLSSFLDDHSRFLVGTELFRNGYASNIVNQFEFLVQEFGRPREVITDHGAQYYSVRRGSSAFQNFCDDQGIEHILGGIGKPTTLGKIERFHRTFRELYPKFNDLSEFREYYNFRRPHGGIEYKLPGELYYRIGHMS